MSNDPLPPSAPRHLRIATWNLWWRFGPWERRAAAIGRQLRLLDADVCTLQEAWVDGDDHLAERLADQLGSYWVSGPYGRPERWCRRLGVSGLGVELAVLSRWPIRDATCTPLPTGDEPDEGLVVLSATIATPWGDLPVVTTHLHSHPAGSATRRRQVDAVARHVARLPATSFPAVVTGDFNAAPDSDEVRRFEGHLTAPAVPGQVLVDTWRYADDGQAAHTWDRRNPYVAATGEPSARVDYVFVAHSPTASRGRVHDVALFGDGPLDDVWPSDHAGVVARLTTGPTPFDV